jgi:hypothetical protein
VLLRGEETETAAAVDEEGAAEVRKCEGARRTGPAAAEAAAASGERAA